MYPADLQEVAHISSVSDAEKEMTSYVSSRCLPSDPLQYWLHPANPCGHVVQVVPSQKLPKKTSPDGRIDVPVDVVVVEIVVAAGVLVVVVLGLTVVGDGVSHATPVQPSEQLHRGVAKEPSQVPWLLQFGPGQYGVWHPGPTHPGLQKHAWAATLQTP